MPKTPQIGEIELEVRKAYGVKPKDGESYEAYVKRIGKAMDDDEGDKKWETLGDAAQEFLVKLSNANRKGTDLPAFPGPEGEDAEEAEDDTKAEADGAKGKKAGDEEGEDEDAEGDTKKKATMKKTSKKAVAKTSKKPVKGEKGAPAKGEKTTAKKKAAADAKPKKKKEKPATTRILELVYEKPDRSSAKVAEILKKEGYECTLSTVTTYRIDFLRYLRFLKAKSIKGLPDLPE